MSLHQQGAIYQEDSLPRIFGRYLLIERLSRGGMGEIFLARHGLSGFEKAVVIKKVLPHLAADHEFITRFIDEAKVAVHLQHANVAQVFEVGRAGDEYFIALEYISGSDLRATLQLLASRGQAMPMELALFIARDVANGLAYAHRRTDAGGAHLALVHCDISPPNVMLSFEGEVKIIDFGIARSRRRMTETNPDRGFGKFGYLAPEQLLKGFAVDQRTDVYALGVVLYEMLTGRHMFELGKNPDYRLLARQVVRGEHALPSSVGPHLAPYDELVATALRPNAQERYQTAADFRDAIQRALVAVSPTINPDHLAGFMRQLHGDEAAAAHRRVMSALNERDIEHWRHQLTSQAGSTVSFARAGGEPAPQVPPHERFDLGGEEARAAARAATGNPAADPDVEEEEDVTVLSAMPTPDPVESLPTVDRSVSFDLPVRPWSLRRVLLTAMVLLMAGGAGAGAWFGVRHLSRPSDGTRVPASSTAQQAAPTAPSPPVAPNPAAAASPAPVARPRVQRPTAPAPTAPAPTAPAPIAPVVQSPSEIQVRELPPEEAEAFEPPPAAEPREQADEPRRKPERKRPRSAPARAAERKPARPAAEAGPDRNAVRSRFRAIYREYAAFKERHGARLDKEWNQLAALANDAESSQRLAELDRKLDEFRDQMRAMKRGKDGSIDPF
jgi:eukaryotic-like serine/threonine-protein kinase